MYFHSFAAKSTAKTSLSGHWPAAIAACGIGLLGLLLKMVVEQLAVTVFRAEYVWGLGVAPEVSALSHWGNLATTAVSLLITLFVYEPLFLGVLRWFWRFTGGQKDPVGEVFYYFAYGCRYRRALQYVWSIGWRLAVATLLVYLPYVLVSMVTGGELFGASVSTALSMLLPVTGLFSSAGVVCYAVYLLRYFLSPWLLFSYEEESVSRILSLSAEMTKGYKSGFVGFLCTFLGWLLLCVLALPVLYVFPWLIASVAVYGRYCINHYLRTRFAAQNGEENIF